MAGVVRCACVCVRVCVCACVCAIAPFSCCLRARAAGPEGRQSKRLCERWRRRKKASEKEKRRWIQQRANTAVSSQTTATVLFTLYTMPHSRTGTERQREGGRERESAKRGPSHCYNNLATMLWSVSTMLQQCCASRRRFIYLLLPATARLGADANLREAGARGWSALLFKRRGRGTLTAHRGADQASDHGGAPLLSQALRLDFVADEHRERAAHPPQQVSWRGGEREGEGGGKAVRGR